MGDAENDVYIYGQEGIGIVKGGKEAFAFTRSSQGLMGSVDMQIFKYESASCLAQRKQGTPVVAWRGSLHNQMNMSKDCCSSTLEADFKSGKIHQAWFVPQ